MLEQFQYRAANYLYMIGMVAEPVVYLVVWSTIAGSQGGSVDGYTADTFAAYYIVWTLVRNMNIVFTPFGWEERIREGTLSGQLVRPMHPIHYDLGYFAGWKFVVIVLWLPIAVVLVADLPPELDPDHQQIVVFFVAIWGAYLIRSLMLWLLGMVTFWTTRVSALFEVYFAASCCCRAGCCRCRLMPEWAQTSRPSCRSGGPSASRSPRSSARSDRELYLGLLPSRAGSWPGVVCGRCGSALSGSYTAVGGMSRWRGCCCSSASA